MEIYVRKYLKKAEKVCYNILLSDENKKHYYVALNEREEDDIILIFTSGFVSQI